MDGREPGKELRAERFEIVPQDSEDRKRNIG
jgi:hypothetical protein